MGNLAKLALYIRGKQRTIKGIRKTIKGILLLAEPHRLDSSMTFRAYPLSEKIMVQNILVSSFYRIKNKLKA